MAKTALDQVSTNSITSPEHEGVQQQTLTKGVQFSA
jgi:hypothetical protein